MHATYTVNRNDRGGGWVRIDWMDALGPARGGKACHDSVLLTRCRGATVKCDVM